MGAPNGILRGLTVVLTHNIMLGGVPMMNGAYVTSTAKNPGRIWTL